MDASNYRFDGNLCWRKGPLLISPGSFCCNMLHPITASHFHLSFQINWTSAVAIPGIEVLGSIPMWHVLLLFFDGLVQDCSISIANALEILQYSTEPSICVTGGWLYLPSTKTCYGVITIQNRWRQCNATFTPKEGDIMNKHKQPLTFFNIWIYIYIIHRYIPPL